MRNRVNRIHFIGIGGAGMSGIAEVLITLGYAVSGSDIKSSTMTERLTSMGAAIHIGHEAQLVRGADLVVISTAIAEENPELVEARRQHIPIVPRAEMLSELMQLKIGIAIAGTHGKTTTTSLVASLLAEGGFDPTFVIGGLLNSAGAHAKLGEGEYLVAEADESDASFLYLQPHMAVVTNIDADHMSTYGGSTEQLRQAFIEFLHHVPFFGLTVLCIDDPVVAGLLDEVSKPILTYGTEPEAYLRAYDIQQSERETRFKVSRGGEFWLDATLNMPGTHNVLNALAAVAIADEVGVNEAAVLSGLQNFQGIGRRFQMYGDLLAKNGHATLIDDYGHHPSEISATVSAIRAGWPTSRLVMVFQPHRYSRTQDLFDEFVLALSETDVLLLCDVYPAGEKKIEGADGYALARALRQRGKVEPIFVSDLNELPELVHRVAEAGDIVLTLGAGSIGQAAKSLQAEVEALQP